MLYFKCENLFLSNAIGNILKQKKIDFHQNVNDFHLSTLILEQKNKSVIIKINENIKTIELPMSHEIFFSTFKKLLNLIKIKIKDLEYFPYQQNIFYNNEKLYLKNIHNQILLKLVLYIDDGIDKELLYKNIWPNEKVVSINKLDSHLTNLKNHIHKEINYFINFSSSNKKIKLIVN